MNKNTALTVDDVEAFLLLTPTGTRIPLTEGYGGMFTRYSEEPTADQLAEYLADPEANAEKWSNLHPLETWERIEVHPGRRKKSDIETYHSTREVAEALLSAFQPIG